MQSAKCTLLYIKGKGRLLIPRSLRFSSFKLFSNTAKLIEIKFHIEHQWGLEVWEIKVCSRDLGHMTKMTVMPTYGKKIWNSSS